MSRAGKLRSRKSRREKPVRLSTSIILRKFAELSIMAAFLGAAFAYQFSLPDRVLGTIHEWMVSINGGKIPGPVTAPRHWLALVIKDLLPFLSAGKPIVANSGVPVSDDTFIRFYGSLPVLELKAVVWLFIGLIGVGAYLCGRGWEKATGVNVFPPDLSPRPLLRNPLRLIPMLAGLLFLGWSLLSFSPLGWPPPVPDAVVEVLASGSNDAVDTSAGGDQQSLIAWLMVAAGLAFLVMAEDVIRTRRLVYKILGLIFGTGVTAALVSILVQADAPLIRSIWIQWGHADFRNDVGGFIGHNTAVSSFLMAPLLIAWTVFSTTRSDRRWARAGIAVSMAIMVITIIMAQSRAVIPILTVMFVSLIFLLARRASIKPSMKFVVGVPLMLFILLATQFVRHDANPFYRDNLPLAQRLRHVTAEHLHTETRLRILMCSLPVIKGHFLQGTGWGSFHYVYPQAQGDYYRKHPRSSILPTPKKTFRAHNEYLQTIFETGAVGLGLALTGLITILLSGWKHMRRSFRQRHIALQVSVLLGICALLMHAALDFPLRVAPLGCTLVLLLAIWSAGDRLWVIRTKSLEERSADPMGSADSSTLRMSGAREIRMEMQLQRDVRGRRTGFNPLIVVWLVGAAFVLSVIASRGAIAATWFGSMVSTLRAGNAIGNWEAPEQYYNNALMAEAFNATGIATRLSPLNGEAWFKEAQAQQYLATDLSQKQINLRSQGGPDHLVEASAREAMDAVARSFFAIDGSMTQYYFHGSWRVRGFCEYLRFTLTGNRNDIRSAIKSMERAMDMNPGDYETARLLIDWKERWERPQDREELLELYGSLRHFNPDYFEEQYVDPIGVMLSIGEYGEASDRATRLLEVEGEESRGMRLARAGAFRSGRIREASEWNRRIPPEENPEAGLYRAFQLLAEDNADAARRELAAVTKENQAVRSVANAVEICIRIQEARAAGDEAEIERLVEEILQAAEQDQRLPYESQRVLEACYGDYETAQKLLRRTLSRFGEAEPFTPRAVLAYLLTKPYDEKLNRLLAERRESRTNGEAPSPALGDNAMREALEEALKLNGEALAICMSKTGSEILQRRIRALELLLGPGNPL